MRTRHVGDLGNIVVPENGRLDGYVVVDHLSSFTGVNNIIGRSIVVRLVLML